jgi:hypothetical protein
MASNHWADARPTPRSTPTPPEALAHPATIGGRGKAQEPGRPPGPENIENGQGR